MVFSFHLKAKVIFQYAKLGSCRRVAMLNTSEINRNELKVWAEGLLNRSELFFNTILMGTCYTEDARTCLSQRPPELSLLRAQSGVLKNIANFLGGVLGGKELGNVCQFASIYN